MTLSQAVHTINKEYISTKQKYEDIAFDPRRKLDEPNEKLHYWDGKRNGLQFAVEVLKKIQFITSGGI